MDTRMLDVAIGLVLVFALLSLIVTAIQEAHTSIRNKRGQNLARLVCSLVGDNRELSNKILAEPFLQSMAMEQPNGAQRTPSYLSGDVFVTGLLGYLSRIYTNGARPPTPQQLITQLKQQMGGKDKTLAINMETLLGGADLDWPSFEKRLQAWFDAVGERASGWYKRENQVHLFTIGLLMAVALNVNPIIITKALWRDAALRTSTVAQAQLALQAYQAQSGLAVTAPAAGSAPTVKPAYVSEQLDGYLTTIQVMLAGMPAPSAKEFQENKPQAFEEATRQAGKLKALLNAERNASEPKQKELRDTAKDGFDLQLGLLHHAARLDLKSRDECRAMNLLSSLCAVFDELKAAVESAKNEVRNERLARGVGQGDPVSTALLRQACNELKGGDMDLCVRFKNLGILEQAGLPIGWADDTWPKVFCRKDGCASQVMALGSLQDAGNWGVAIAGWLLTAVAVTLGAPFWFDLLGKLIKIRGSGGKPADSEAGAVPNSTTGGAPAANPTGGATAGQTASQDAINDAERGLTEDEVIRIQRALPVPADKQSGRLDLVTREAIATWQKKNGAVATGQLTQQQIHTLLHPIDLEDDGYVG